MQEKKVETTLIKASVILLLVSTATSIIVFFLLNYMFDYSGSRLLFENDTSDFQTKSLSIYEQLKAWRYVNGTMVLRIHIEIIVGLMTFLLVEFMGMGRLELYITKKRMEIEKEQFIQTLSQKQHEFNRHLQAIRILAERCCEKTSSVYEIVDYIDALMCVEKERSPVFYLNDGVISAYLEKKKRDAERRDVKLTVLAHSEKCELQLERQELVELVGNLTENAIDAAEMNRRGKRDVYVEIESTRKRCRIVTINTKPTEFDAIADNILRDGFSTKNNCHRGHGLTNVQKIVNRHDGSLEILTDDETVIFQVIIEW